MTKMQATKLTTFCMDYFISPQRRKGRKEGKGFPLPLSGRQGKSVASL